MTDSNYHVPVLLEEALAALQVKEGGVYVDCTFGGGGHALGILDRMGPAGRLIAFDQDADAKANVPDDGRITFVPHNFRYLQRFLRLHKVPEVNGILADLGVSSHQFDEPGRGFSTRFEGALDMRMDQRQDLTAEKVLNSYGEHQLHKLFERFGEVTNARTLARSIAEARRIAPLRTIADLRNAAHGIVRGNPHKYFAQVFQALRIEVNDEWGALKELLLQVPGVLAAGGRVAVITFHSLEDRTVKQFFKTGTVDDEQDDHDPFGSAGKTAPLKVITRKPVTPSNAEQQRNRRSRSAKLRVAEKI